MKINPKIFKEYDVRGIYPGEINSEAAYKIGTAFAVLLKARAKQKIVVGRDKRKSSKPLAEAFINGITDSGIGAIDIGIVTTPMLYFAIPRFGAIGGAMITASHNPLKYNGIKFAGKNSEPIGGAEIRKATNACRTSHVRQREGAVEKASIEGKYFKEVYKNFNRAKTNKIPHSFDFDRDRLMVKDKKGNKIRGDIIGGIIADTTAKKGDAIVYDLRCSKAIPEYFRNKGVRAFPSMVGHFNIKKLMRKKKAVFGMELTGHYYFKKFHYCESPDFGLRKLAEQTDKTKKTMGELAEPFIKYWHSGIINFPAKGGANGWKKIAGELKKKYAGGAVNFTDGITVEFSNWWFNLRPSNTEPLFRLVVEAHSKKILREKKKELLEKIKKI